LLFYKIVEVQEAIDGVEKVIALFLLDQN